MVELSSVGVLTFDRARTWQDLLRTYQVFVDGKLVGRLKRSSELSMDLPSGRYACRVGIDWSGSPTVTAEVRAGEVTMLHVLPGVEGDRLERGLSAEGYLRIEIEEGTS
jgi:hypothetical protein